MTGKAKRAQYTLEFKLEAVRLVKAGQSMAAVAAALRVVEQTLYNWSAWIAQAQSYGFVDMFGNRDSLLRDLARRVDDACDNPLSDESTGVTNDGYRCRFVAITIAS
jgi:Transposase